MARSTRSSTSLLDGSYVREAGEGGLWEVELGHQAENCRVDMKPRGMGIWRSSKARR